MENSKLYVILIVSIVVFVLYGGALWGIIPTDAQISWESHLCGFLSGILIARIHARRSKYSSEKKISS